MTKFAQPKLEELMVKRRGSVDPSKFPSETFELFSIPAFDSGEAVVIDGSEIGSSKQNVEPGDVLLSKIVPHIRRAWVVTPRKGYRQIASGEWMIFKHPDAFPDYLRHLLTSDWFHPMLMNTVAGVGGSLVRARPSEIARIEIPLPPIAEQKRIAAILDKADGIRRKLQQSLRLSDDFLRSVFLDMFGDPVTNPKGWKIARMGDYSDQLTGFAFKSSEYVQAGDGIRLCRGTNVLPCEIDWSDRADWPEDQCSQLERYQLIEGDIVVAMDRPWISSGFKTARITKQDIPSLLVQRVARIRAKKPLNNNYLFCLLNQGSFARHCKPTETTIPHISPVELREFPIAIPDVSLLEQFDRIFLKQSHAKESVKKKVADAEHLFFSLQQLAFRGEL
jgi:type I restriction enzyme S subunit